MRSETCLWWSAMDKAQRFEDFLVERNDAIDNAAYFLALTMLYEGGKFPEGDEFPWSMEIIGAILESTTKVLEEHGHHACWPYHGNDDDTPCYVLDDCKHKDCPLKR